MELAARPVSDATSNYLLGAILLCMGAAVLAGYAGGLRDFASAEFFPALIALCMLAAGALLVVAGYFAGNVPVRWTWLQLLAAVVIVVAVTVGLALYFLRLFLDFGPPEYAATILMLYAAAFALARRSHLRALGMMLIGLLLSTVGLDIITGRMRFTFGTELLIDGFDFFILAPGIILVADALLILISPALWLSTFRWLAGEWQNRAMPPILSIVLRAIAVAIVIACVWLAYALRHHWWDIPYLFLFATFGIAAKLLGWNRAVLVFAFFYARQFEQSLRQSLYLTDGSFTVLFDRPFSRFHVLAAAALLVFTFGLWLWRVRRAKRQRLP